MYLTVREVAEELRCSPLTVRRMVAAGRLSALRLGGSLRISREALAALAVRYLNPPPGLCNPEAKRKGPASCN